MSAADTATARSHHRQQLCWLGAALGVLVLAAAWRLYLLTGLDLSDIPGPGGVQFLALALDTTPGDPPLPALVYRWAIGFSGLEPVPASQLLGVCSSVLGIAGGMAATWALLGRHAAIATGLLLACWAQHLQQALLVGMGAPACALAWTGLGLAWWGARIAPRGLPLTLLGGALVALGAGLKPTALPVLALLAFVPLLSWRPWWSALASTVATGLGVVAGRAALAPFATASPDVQTTLPAIGDVVSGWSLLASHRQSEPEGALLELAILGAGAALVPGKHQLRRLLLLAASAALMGYASHSLGDWLRFRYLVPAALGCFVLAGDGLGRFARWLPRFRVLAWVPVAVVCTLLSLDALAFHQAWSDARAPVVGTTAHDLLAAPTPWTWRYRDLSWDSSLSTQGAASLMALVMQAPPAGVAVLPLQDERHNHAEAAAAIAGVPIVLLEQQGCCPSDQHAVICARETIAALEQAGALVVLLPRSRSQARVPKAHFAWIQSVQGAAWGAYEVQDHDDWWATLQSAGTGAPLPCGG